MSRPPNSQLHQDTAISLENLWKSYSDTIAVAGIDLSISGGEFCTILGPSGSGKTTTLMMVAGFVVPSRGRILIDDIDITRLAPQKREMGIVFQSYALFPHMNVFNNVAFPLVMRRTPRAEIRKVVSQMLKIVQLDGLEERLPRQLSGGQQQRVAVARALVFEPRVLLMDEPLGSLDKKLRSSLQLELKRLQKRLNVTVIYVTHDQEEALTISDKVVVMNNGRIEQTGRPEILYEHPETRFVADFIGDSNFVSGVVSRVTGKCAMIEHPAGWQIQGLLTSDIKIKDKVVAAMRPERLSIFATEPKPAEGAENVLQGRVEEIVYQGDAVKYRILVGESRPSLTQTLIVKQPAGGSAHSEGAQVYVCWPQSKTRLLRSEQSDEPPDG